MNEESNFHDVQNLSFSGDTLHLTVSGEEYEIDLKDLAKQSDRLLKANEAARSLYKIYPSGEGIHWMALNEDLSVSALMKIAKSHRKIA